MGNGSARFAVGWGSLAAAALGLLVGCRGAASDGARTPATAPAASAGATTQPARGGGVDLTYREPKVPTEFCATQAEYTVEVGGVPRRIVENDPGGSYRMMHKGSWYWCLAQFVAGKPAAIRRTGIRDAAQVGSEDGARDCSAMLREQSARHGESAVREAARRILDDLPSE